MTGGKVILDNSLAQPLGLKLALIWMKIIKYIELWCFTLLVQED